MQPAALAFLILLFGGAALQAAPPEKESDTTALIHWLLADKRDLKGIPFSKVLAATTGKKIYPIDPTGDAAWLAQLAKVLDKTLESLNKPEHKIHTTARVNEASRFIEDEIMAQCRHVAGWSCGVPPSADGAEQRSG